MTIVKVICSNANDIKTKQTLIIPSFQLIYFFYPTCSFLETYTT